LLQSLLPMLIHIFTSQIK